jgi:beta-1,4-mannosyltransferase
MVWCEYLMSGTRLNPKAKKSQPGQIRIASYPDLDKLKANPYWGILKDDIQHQGYSNVTDASFQLSWLWANRKKIHILHFHYVQPFYEYEYHYARFRWVLRFGRNLIVAKILGYRCVFTLHDLSPTFPLKPEWVNMLGHKIIIRLADRIIVHCETARDLLARHYRRTKNVIVVPHPSFDGVYPNDISNKEARIKIGLSDRNLVFTFFGGIRPNKGLEQLIQAFARLEDPNLRLIIAGAPFPPDEYIQKLKILGGNDSRIGLFLEHISDHDVQIYMNAADIVVLPFSRILTSSSTMLALTFGKPVIVPQMGCLPELVDRESGWLYSPEDVDGLYDALQSAMNDDIEAKAINARKIADRFRDVSLAYEMYSGI